MEGEVDDRVGRDKVMSLRHSDTIECGDYLGTISSNLHKFRVTYSNSNNSLLSHQGRARSS